MASASAVRSLFVPELYTAENLAGISTINALRDLHEGMRQIGRPVPTTMIVPRSRDHVNWDDDMFDDPLLDPLPVGFPYEPAYDMSPISPDVLEPVLPKRGRLLFDFVLNGKYMHSATVAAAFQKPLSQWEQWHTIPVVTWLFESGLDRRLPLFRETAGRALLCASSSVGPVMVFQDADRDWLLDVLFAGLHPSRVAEISERLFVIPAAVGFDYESVQRRRAAERREKPVLFHGGSGEGKRRIPLMLRLAEQMRDRIDVLLTTQWKRSGRWVFADAEAAGFEVVYQVTRDQYRQLLHRGDIVWVGAEYEGTGIAYVEAVMSGMLPLVYQAPWMEKRLPASYPFVASSEMEAGLMLREMVADLDRLRSRWVGELQEAMSVHLPDRTAEAYADMLDMCVAPVVAENVERSMKVTPAFRLLAQAVEEEGWHEVNDPNVLWEAMKVRSEKKVEFKYVSPMTLRFMLMGLGYVDPGDSTGFRMVRCG